MERHTKTTKQKPKITNAQSASRKTIKKRYQQNVLLFTMTCFGYSFVFKSPKKSNKKPVTPPCLRILKVNEKNFENDVVRELRLKIKKYPGKKDLLAATTVRVIVDALSNYGFVLAEKTQKKCDPSKKHPIINFLKFEIQGSVKLNLEESKYFEISNIGEDLNKQFKTSDSDKTLVLDKEVLNSFFNEARSGSIQLRNETWEFINAVLNISIETEHGLGKSYIERTFETNNCEYAGESSLGGYENGFVFSESHCFAETAKKMSVEQQIEISPIETNESCVVEQKEITIEEQQIGSNACYNRCDYAEPVLYSKHVETNPEKVYDTVNNYGDRQDVGSVLFGPMILQKLNDSPLNSEENNPQKDDYKSYENQGFFSILFTD